MCRNGYNKVLCIEIGMGCFRALERTSGMAARKMSVKSEGSWPGEEKGRGRRSSAQS